MSESDDEEYVRHVNREIVRVDDLRTILTEAAREPKRNRSFEDLIALVIEVLPDISTNERVAVISDYRH